MSEIFSPKEIMAMYKKIASNLLPEDEYKKEVSPEESEKELSLIRDTIEGERFMFVVNLHTMEIEHVSGVQRWLGYNDKDFSLYDYLKIIHPAHVAMHQLTSLHSLEDLMRGNYDIEFMKHRYITNIALKHINGSYLLCKRLASVFQYFIKDNRHCLLEYINEFTILDAYNDEPYVIRTGYETNVENNWRVETMKMLKKVFEEERNFSKQELRILRLYANNQNIQIADIANILEIASNTVTTYHKRILEKAESLFPTRFASVKETAGWLRKQGLI